jgi:hypothetical protein
LSIEIITEALKSSMIVTITVAMAIAVLSNILTSRIIKPEKREEKAKEKLFKLLNSRLQENKIFDLEFLKYVKSSIEREFDVTLVISHIIEDYLVHKLTEDAAEQDQAIEKLKQLLDTEKQVKPFDSLPSEERRLLKGLKDIIDESDASSRAGYFIDELSTVMSVRNGEYQRSHQTNKWSVPLAIIGLIFTIVFGLMSIISGPSEEAVVKKAIQAIDEQKSNK